MADGTVSAASAGIATAVLVYGPDDPAPDLATTVQFLLDDLRAEGWRVSRLWLGARGAHLVFDQYDLVLAVIDAKVTAARLNGSMRPAMAEGAVRPDPLRARLARLLQTRPTGVSMTLRCLATTRGATPVAAQTPAPAAQPDAVPGVTSGTARGSARGLARGLARGSSEGSAQGSTRGTALGIAPRVAPDALTMAQMARLCLLPMFEAAPPAVLLWVPRRLLLDPGAVTAGPADLLLAAPDPDTALATAPPPPRHRPQERVRPVHPRIIRPRPQTRAQRAARSSAGRLFGPPGLRNIHPLPRPDRALARIKAAMRSDDPFVLPAPEPARPALAYAVVVQWIVLLPVALGTWLSYV